jgi:hypothetical protein
MATAAQIEANRRNAQRSVGPRTQAGKDRSKLNALGHGCRANILVLPTFRIDMPHLERKGGAIGITGKRRIHPALHRLQSGRSSTVLDLSSIFGK